MKSQKCHQVANNMKTNKTIYSCVKCGAQFSAWEGRCRECGSWGSLQKENVAASKEKAENYLPLTPDQIIDFDKITGAKVARISLGEKEIDRVLGGGIVPGSLVLLGGDPGIGKSTLMLKVADLLSRQKKTVFYVSGEESAEQIKLRIDRLNITTDNLKYIPLVSVEKIAATLIEHKPELAVIDSIQTIYSEEANGEPGSISQVRAIAVKLLEVAKQHQISIILIGHVTKGGEVAGPKTLEHLVDTVLYLEGDNVHNFRILRSVKNRFGPAGEVGVFVMTSKGLAAVSNPATAFLSASEKAVPGSVQTVVWEGSRPFVVEVQALVSKTSSTYPKRSVSGFDLNRLQLLLAVLAKWAKVNLSTFDVYVSLAGGFKSADPALDLAVCLALVSAKSDKPLPGVIAFGEVGLTGSLRPVPQFDKRLKEAASVGLVVICPEVKKKIVSRKVKIITAKNIKEAVRSLDGIDC